MSRLEEIRARCDLFLQGDRSKIKYLAEASRDVPWLLAEVERLQTELANAVADKFLAIGSKQAEVNELRAELATAKEVIADMITGDDKLRAELAQAKELLRDFNVLAGTRELSVDERARLMSLTSAFLARVKAAEAG